MIMSDENLKNKINKLEKEKEKLHEMNKKIKTKFNNIIHKKEDKLKRYETKFNENKESLNLKNKKIKKIENERLQLENESAQLKAKMEESQNEIDTLIEENRENKKMLNTDNHYIIPKSNRKLTKVGKPHAKKVIKRVSDVIHKVAAADENAVTPYLDVKEISENFKTKNLEHIFELDEDVLEAFEILINLNESYIGKISESESFKQRFLRAQIGGINLENELKNILLDMWIALCISEKRFDEGVKKQLKVLEEILNCPNLIVGGKTLRKRVKELTVDFEIYLPSFLKRELT